MFPGLFEADAFSQAECLGAWRHIKSVRELNLCNREFQGTKEAMVIYCLEVVNALLSCKILQGTLFSVTQYGKDQLSKQKSRVSTSCAKNILTPSNTRLVSAEARQTLPHSEGALPEGCVPEESSLPPGLPPRHVGWRRRGWGLAGLVSGVYLLLVLTCLSLAIMERYIWRKNGSGVAFYSNNFSRKYYD